MSICIKRRENLKRGGILFVQGINFGKSGELKRISCLSWKRNGGHSFFYR